jgi:hypothetical protein
MSKTDNCYLIIESNNPKKTSEFYSMIGLKVTKGHPLGDYLVFTDIGYITINEKAGNNSPAIQSYKPIINLDLTRSEIEVLIRNITTLGSKIEEKGEFLSMVGYECEDFSGGRVTLCIGILS